MLACFFTDCSIKLTCELAKVLLAHHRSTTPVVHSSLVLLTPLKLALLVSATLAKLAIFICLLLASIDNTSDA
jgi:hypothetical protein